MKPFRECRSRLAWHAEWALLAGFTPGSRASRRRAFALWRDGGRAQPFHSWSSYGYGNRASSNGGGGLVEKCASALSCGTPTGKFPYVGQTISIKNSDDSCHLPGKTVVSQFAETFPTCHAERRARPGKAGISASRSIPGICPEACSFKAFSSMSSVPKLFAFSEITACLGRLPVAAWANDKFSRWFDFASRPSPAQGVRASLTMT